MDCDIVIAGGGLVGASLAAALANSAVRVTVVEAVPLSSDTQPSYDERMVALTWPSRRIFEGLGVWRQIAAANASAIDSIHVSNRGHFGMTRLSVKDLKGDANAQALGYLVPTRIMGRALHRAIEAAPNVQLLCPNRVVRAENADHSIRVTTENGDVDARLLVVADGGRSTLADSLGMRARLRQYPQHALVTVISPDRDHAQCAYERFTDSGPLALLPATDGRFAVAWTVEATEGERLLALADDAFLAELQQAFGQRAGHFIGVGARRLYPLAHNVIDSPIARRAVAIGNAAHTVHPVAGQGFNLGLRDVACLAEMIFDAVTADSDPGAGGLLRAYARARRADTRRVASLTDGLIRGFGSGLLPVVVGRNAGLSAINLLPPVRRRLLNATMGLGIDAGRLAHGVPLSREDGSPT